jgi:hypothetical protein
MSAFDIQSAACCSTLHTTTITRKIEQESHWVRMPQQPKVLCGGPLPDTGDAHRVSPTRIPAFKSVFDFWISNN